MPDTNYQDDNVDLDESESQNDDGSVSGERPVC